MEGEWEATKYVGLMVFFNRIWYSNNVLDNGLTTIYVCFKHFDS